MNIHPKVALGSVFGAFGVVLVTVLGSVHGIHLSAAANGAIPTFLTLLGGWLAPSPSDPVTSVTGNKPTLIQEPPVE